MFRLLRHCRRFFTVVLLAPAVAPAQTWQFVRETRSEKPDPALAFVSREFSAGNRRVTLDLVTFDPRSFTLTVVDQGATDPPTHPSRAAAMQANFCVAGCNGGFFHPDNRPSGLVIAGGQRINRFEQAKLLSGVLLVDAKGPQILRRAEFKDHPGITALLQSGPFLVDGGTTVAGLSASPERRRTFLFTDGSHHWGLGLAGSSSLAELGLILAIPDATGSGCRVTRALNLDGGTSCGLYFDRGAGERDHAVEPFKRVRNFVGVAPR